MSQTQTSDGSKNADMRAGGLQAYAASLSMMQQAMAAGLRLSDQMHRHMLDSLRHQAALASSIADRAEVNLLAMMKTGDDGGLLYKEVGAARQQSTEAIRALRAMADDARSAFFDAAGALTKSAATPQPPATAAAEKTDPSPSHQTARSAPSKAA